MGNGGIALRVLCCFFQLLSGLDVLLFSHDSITSWKLLSRVSWIFATVYSVSHSSLACKKTWIAKFQGLLVLLLLGIFSHRLLLRPHAPLAAAQFHNTYVILNPSGDAVPCHGHDRCSKIEYRFKCRARQACLMNLNLAAVYISQWPRRARAPLPDCQRVRRPPMMGFFAKGRVYPLLIWALYHFIISAVTSGMG